MPTKSETPPIESLADRIAAKRKEISDAVEALRVLEQQPRWQPQPGELPILDRLQDFMTQLPADRSQSEAMESLHLAIERAKLELRDLEAAYHRDVLESEFNEFQQQICPAVERIHRAIDELLDSWEALEGLRVEFAETLESRRFRMALRLNLLNRLPIPQLTGSGVVVKRWDEAGADYLAQTSLKSRNRYV